LTAGFVVDASVALKWVSPEDDSDAAATLLTLGVPLAAPAFIFVEIANVLWVQARAGKLDAAGAAACLADLRRLPLNLWSDEELLPSALELAFELDHAIYDCAYLAVALHLGQPFVTADGRFRRKAEATPRVAGWVIGLDQIGP
jgi:predicted nucleic acid-binding protein